MVGADPGKLKAMIAKVAAMAPATGSGQKVGGDASAPAPAPAAGSDDLRSRMAAAAEARMKAAQPH